MIYFTLYEFTCRKTKLETNGIMLEHKDYISSLNKARKKRNQNIDPRYLEQAVPAGRGGGDLLGCPARRRPFAAGGSGQEGSGGDTKDH